MSIATEVNAPEVEAPDDTAMPGDVAPAGVRLDLVDGSSVPLTLVRGERIGDQRTWYAYGPAGERMPRGAAITCDEDAETSHVLLMLAVERRDDGMYFMPQPPPRLRHLTPGAEPPPFELDPLHASFALLVDAAGQTEIRLRGVTGLQAIAVLMRTVTEIGVDIGMEPRRFAELIHRGICSVVDATDQDTYPGQYL